MDAISVDQDADDRAAGHLLVAQTIASVFGEPGYLASVKEDHRLAVVRDRQLPDFGQRITAFLRASPEAEDIEVAQAVCCSIATVKKWRKRKFGTSGRVHAAMKAHSVALRSLGDDKRSLEAEQRAFEKFLQIPCKRPEDALAKLAYLKVFGSASISVSASNPRYFKSGYPGYQLELFVESLLAGLRT